MSLEDRFTSDEAVREAEAVRAMAEETPVGASRDGLETASNNLEQIRVVDRDFAETFIDTVIAAKKMKDLLGKDNYEIFKNVTNTELMPQLTDEIAKFAAEIQILLSEKDPEADKEEIISSIVENSAALMDTYSNLIRGNEQIKKMFEGKEQELAELIELAKFVLQKMIISSF